jgi:hypothetical protein
VLCLVDDEQRHGQAAAHAGLVGIRTGDEHLQAGDVVLDQLGQLFGIADEECVVAVAVPVAFAAVRRLAPEGVLAGGGIELADADPYAIGVADEIVGRLDQLGPIARAELDVDRLGRR